MSAPVNLLELTMAELGTFRRYHSTTPARDITTSAHFASTMDEKDLANLQAFFLKFHLYNPHSFFANSLLRPQFH